MGIMNKCAKFGEGSEEEKTCFKTSDKDGNMGSLSRDVSPSQGLLQSTKFGEDSFWR